MKAPHTLAIALAGALVGQVGAPQTTPFRAVGIVEIPRLFADTSSGGLTAADRNLRLELRQRPGPESPLAATISSPDQLESREYAYELAGAVVYARERGWNLVRAVDGVAGWLAPREAGAFHSLESLITAGLPYLTDDWDGLISEAPESQIRRRVPDDPARRLIGFLVPQAETSTPYLMFERPDRSSKVIGEVTAKNLETTLQTTHDIPRRVLVLDRQQGWFQVVLTDLSPRRAARVWIEELPVWRFQPVDDEAQRRQLATRAWGPESWSVQTRSTRRLGDALWVEVEILSHSLCEDPEPPTVRARGWIRAQAASGAPAIWFYSRGC
jgi:hypothetical protein